MRSLFLIAIMLPAFLFFMQTKTFAESGVPESSAPVLPIDDPCPSLKSITFSEQEPVWPYSPDHHGPVVVMTGCLWKTSIFITQGKPEWHQERRPLNLSPTLVDKGVYVPVDLEDAWRELDRMLPDSYKNYRQQLLRRGPCVYDAPEYLKREIGLISFLDQAWFPAGGSRYFDKISEKFDLDLKGVKDEYVRERYREEMAYGLAYWTLCSFDLSKKFSKAYAERTLNRIMIQADDKFQKHFRAWERRRRKAEKEEMKNDMKSEKGGKD
jgi:hypothetical protein